MQAVSAKDADFTWEGGYASAEAAPTPNVHDISLEVTRGSLIAVVGRVGSGKSSLLSAILGEMDKLRGYVGVRGQVAYVPQQAWIQNMSLRDNITFGQPYNKVLYDKVIEVCALKPDLDILPHGDATEIGEKVGLQFLFTPFTLSFRE